MQKLMLCFECFKEREIKSWPGNVGSLEALADMFVMPFMIG